MSSVSARFSSQELGSALTASAQCAIHQLDGAVIAYIIMESSTNCTLLCGSLAHVGKRTLS